MVVVRCKRRVIFVFVAVIVSFGCASIVLLLVGAGALSYGIVANVCYFAGPVVELYMSRVFDKQLGTKGRYALFGAGLAFSMAVTMGVVAYTGVYGVVGLFG